MANKEIPYKIYLEEQRNAKSVVQSTGRYEKQTCSACLTLVQCSP